MELQRSHGAAAGYHRGLPTDHARLQRLPCHRPGDFLRPAHRQPQYAQQQQMGGSSAQNAEAKRLLAGAAQNLQEALQVLKKGGMMSGDPCHGHRLYWAAIAGLAKYISI